MIFRLFLHSHTRTLYHDTAPELNDNRIPDRPTAVPFAGEERNQAPPSVTLEIVNQNSKSILKKISSLDEIDKGLFAY